MEAETSSIRSLEVEKLKPDNISGAVIKNKSQIGKWTVEKLKFWLKCRRLNQQGNKRQLLESNNSDSESCRLMLAFYYILLLFSALTFEISFSRQSAGIQGHTVIMFMTQTRKRST